MKSLSILLLSISLLLSQNYVERFDAQSNIKTSFCLLDAQLEIDPESIDLDLLEATFLKRIEKRRPKLNVISFKATKSLTSISENLLAKYSFGNIKYAMRKNKLSKRKWKRIIKAGDFKGSYAAIAIATAPLYDFPKNEKIYRNQSETEIESPFYYKQWKKKMALSPHTYDSLVDYLLTNAAFSDNRKILKSKGLSEIGFAFRIEDREEGKMPYISIAVTGGGYRLQRLSDTTKEN